MAHHSIGDVGDGHLGSWGFPEGGMGAVADACRRSAEGFGATVRINARLREITVRDGRADGVVLVGGEELKAPVVVTSIHPKITFLQQIERKHLPPDFVRDIEHWKSRSGVVKINLALAVYLFINMVAAGYVEGTVRPPQNPKVSSESR